MLEKISERTNGWMESQKRLVDNSIDLLINSWGLNKALKDLNPLQKKQAGFVMETMMAAYGLNISPALLSQVVEDFYPGIDDHLKGGLTDNHKSLAVTIHEDGVATAVKYAPVFVGEKEIGIVSPLKIYDAGEKTKVNFGNGLTPWTLNIDFIIPPPHATKQFSFQGETYFGKSYVDACVSGQNGGFVLIDSGHPCEQGCKFCTYSQGISELNPNNFSKLEPVLDFLAKSTGKITACLSSGSSLSPDRGIINVFTPMLEIIDELKTKYPKTKVELELELMPWQISTNQAVLEMIKKYHQKGFIKAVNLNLETPLGIDRSEFMSTDNFGKAGIPIAGQNGDNQGYLETFQLLKLNFPDLKFAGLVLFGLKPQSMGWSEYTKLCLETVKLFAQNDVKLLFQPVKISSTTQMADYPLIDPFWLTGAILLADLIHINYKLNNKHKVGCVNGCDACDPSRAGYGLLNYCQSIAGNEGINQLLKPWLEIINNKQI